MSQCWDTWPDHNGSYLSRQREEHLSLQRGPLWPLRITDSVGVEGSWPAALDELLARVLHCCYGDSWSTRIGGLSAVTLLAQRYAPGSLGCRYKRTLNTQSKCGTLWILLLLQCKSLLQYTWGCCTTE